MTAEQKLATALRETRMDGECSPIVEDRLRAAFRQRRPRALWPYFAAGAIAAGLAVFLMISAQRTPTRVDSPQPVAAVRIPPPAAVEPVASVPRPVVRAVNVRAVKKKPARREEVATPFFALDAGLIGESPRGYTMRVQVPRSTMASFGLPVNQELADQRVDADVLLGSDGSARAIRFVRAVR